MSTGKRNGIWMLALLVTAGALPACGEMIDDGTTVESSPLLGPTMPAGWTKTFIGTNTPAGSALYDPVAGGFQIEGSGAFPNSHYFVYRSFAGDGQIVANLAGDVAGGDSARFGIAIKAQLNNSSSMVAMTSNNDMGTFSLEKLGSAAPTEITTGSLFWVKITRQGNLFSTYVSLDGVSWVLRRQSTLPGVGAAAFYGLIVASGNSNVTAQGKIGLVQVGKLNPFTSKDVGTVGATGSLTYDGTERVWTESGGGQGMVGTADALQFAYQPLKGDGSFSAFVEPPYGPGTGTRAGVMLRSSLNANAAGVFLSMDNADRLLFGKRSAVGGAASESPYTATAYSALMRLERTGNVIRAWDSSCGNGYCFNLIGQVTIPNLPETVYMGVGVTGGVVGQRGTTTFSEPTLSPLLVQP